VIAAGADVDTDMQLFCGRKVIEYAIVQVNKTFEQSAGGIELE